MVRIYAGSAGTILICLLQGPCSTRRSFPVEAFIRFVMFRDNQVAFAAANLVGTRKDICFGLKMGQAFGNYKPRRMTSYVEHRFLVLAQVDTWFLSFYATIQIFGLAASPCSAFQTRNSSKKPRTNLRATIRSICFLEQGKLTAINDYISASNVVLCPT